MPADTIHSARRPSGRAPSLRKPWFTAAEPFFRRAQAPKAGRFARVFALLVGLSAAAAGLVSSGAEIPGGDLPVTASVTVGFDPQKPFRRESAWVPARVRLDNRGEAVSGEVVIQIKDGRVVYKAPADLPARGSADCNLFVHLPDQLDELEFYFDTGRERYEFEIITVAAPSIETARFLVVMADERGRHENLAHREEEDVEYFREVAYTGPALLPRHWTGYQNIDTLVWDGASPAQLTPAQESALETWIQMGGSLVLGSGENWQALEQSSLRLYSPVTMTGSVALAPGAAAEATVDGGTVTLGPGMVLATGALVDDPKIKVWLRAEGHPLMAERPWGAGRVVWLGTRLDEPLFDPLRQGIFYRFIASSSAAIPSRAVDQLDTFVTAFLRWMVQAELPGTLFIATYLGVYILILAPVNYVVFSRIGRLEWAWFTIPLWAALFAYGAYYIGALRQQGAVLANSVSIVESRPNARSARATTYCSIYSPVRRRYTVTFDDPPAFPRLPVIMNYRRQSLRASEDNLAITFANNGVQLRDYLIYHWSQRTFKADHAVPTGNGVAMDLKWDGGRVTGTIVNNTGLVLRDAGLYLKGRFVSLGTMEDGGAADIDREWLSAEPASHNNVFNRMRGRERGFDEYGRDASRMIREDLKDFYANLLYTETVSRGMMLFAAQADVSALGFHLDGDWVTPKGSTLFLTLYPVQHAFEGVREISPAQWTLAGGANMGGYGFGMQPFPPAGMDQSGINIQNGGEFLGELMIDAPLLSGKINSLQIGVNYDRFEVASFRAARGEGETVYTRNEGKPADSAFEAQLQNLDTREYMPLSAIADAEGFIANPSDYLDKAHGRLRFRIAAPPDAQVTVPAEAIRVFLLMNYGSADQGTFLGYPLELARALRE